MISKEEVIGLGNRLGFEVITAYPVLDETVWVKWGYEIAETEEDGNMKLKKDLT